MVNISDISQYTKKNMSILLHVDFTGTLKMLNEMSFTHTDGTKNLKRKNFMK